jgi:Sec-independent protein translocase protein TatA
MVIVGVILLLMGPDKLPEVAHKLGATWRTLKKLQEKVEAEVREAIPDLPSTGDIARLARSPVNLLNQLADRVDAKEAAERASATTSEGVTDDESAPLLVSPPLPPPRSVRNDDTSLPPDPSLN